MITTCNLGPVYAFKGDTYLEKNYRAVLALEDNQEPRLWVQQQIGDRWVTCGSWRLTTILSSATNILHLDWGQGWYVTGLDSIRLMFEQEG